MPDYDFGALPSPREVRHFYGKKKYRLLLGGTEMECGSFSEAQLTAHVLGFRIIRQNPVHFDDFLQYTMIPLGFTLQSWAIACARRLLDTGLIDCSRLGKAKNTNRKNKKK